VKVGVWVRVVGVGLRERERAREKEGGREGGRVYLLGGMVKFATLPKLT
jgi:hypothetical protein